MKHEWGPARLNHGNAQCIHCHCTDLEARYALGDECPSRKPPSDNVVQFPRAAAHRAGEGE